MDFILTTQVEKKEEEWVGKCSVQTVDRSLEGEVSFRTYQRGSQNRVRVDAKKGRVFLANFPVPKGRIEKLTPEQQVVVSLVVHQVLDAMGAYCFIQDLRTDAEMLQRECGIELLDHGSISTMLHCPPEREPLLRKAFA